MSKHDTWVQLRPGHPFEPIMRLFPKGFPMRDPFPMGLSKDNSAALWFMDSDRLDSNQIHHIAETIAAKHGVSSDEVLNEALSNEGFAVNNIWIANVTGGVENYRRNIESADFLESHLNATKKDFEEFYQQQYRDWIHGDKIPEPLPDNYEDINPRFKSPEMEAAFKQWQINKLLQQGGYSVWDVMNGTAMAEVMNKLDSEAEWSLATGEDWD